MLSLLVRHRTYVDYPYYCCLEFPVGFYIVLSVRATTNETKLLQERAGAETIKQEKKKPGEHGKAGHSVSTAVQYKRQLKQFNRFTCLHGTRACLRFFRCYAAWWSVFGK
jgi:hypothetical protein